MQKRLLLVDDEPIICKSLSHLLGRDGYQIWQANCPLVAMQILQEQEDRLAMVTERRNRLMDLDRKKNQEAFLAEQRKLAADVQSRPEDVQ